jgi:transposase
MEPMFDSVAGVDVHKEKITITALTQEPMEKMKRETWECLTFTQDLEECGRKILKMGIKHVAMESTGIYWVPVYNVWSAMGIIVTLGNASHIKNVPGRKTDVKDSEWIATLHRSGLIRPSYIPEEKFRELRLLTRHRRGLIEDMARIKNRIQKILEDGNIKLGSVISDIFGVAGMAIIEGIANGHDDPCYLASLATTKIKCTKEDLRKSLTHTLKEYHRFILQNLLIQLKYLEQIYIEIDKKIDDKMIPHRNLIEQLISIPGIDQKLAEDIVAEATTNVSSFKDDRHFAAWAGVAPGNHESASKKKRQNVDMGIPV